MAIEESDEMLDFRDWINGQEGEDYSENAIKGFGWKYVAEEVRYPNGVKTHYSKYTMKDSGLVYFLEVAWSHFNETIVNSHIWTEEPKNKKKFRITFRSEVYIEAETAKEAEELFGEVDLFSHEMEKLGAQYIETNSVEEQGG